MYMTHKLAMHFNVIHSFQIKFTWILYVHLYDSQNTNNECFLSCNVKNIFMRWKMGNSIFHLMKIFLLLHECFIWHQNFIWHRIFKWIKYKTNTYLVQKELKSNKKCQEMF
jgi:hypothetical protein